MAQSVRGQLSSQVDAPQSTPVVAKTESGRLAIFLHALFFVLGFGTVFTLVGSAAGLLGQSLNAYMPMIQRLGAILLVIFGLTTLGIFRWLIRTIEASTDVARNPAAAALISVLDFFNTLLYTEKRVADMHTVNRNWGYLSSALLGVSFSAGWVPCIGPILASILFLASDSATAGQGALLLAVYSLGLGIPFLFVGAAFSRASTLLRKINRFSNVIGIISGLFLFAVAYLLWNEALVTLTARFNVLNQFMLSMNNWVLAGEDWMGAVSGTGGDLLSLSLLGAMPLAFFAGLISFISPCVLPLVPAYIGYLSGTAIGSGSKKA